MIDFCEVHGVSSAEEIGLHLIFQERKNRGSELIKCVVQATELSSGGADAIENTEASSWQEMKNSFPTIKDLLVDLGLSENWMPYSENDRILFVEASIGHEGLYDDAINASVLLKASKV